jgi:NAD(P)-dependent dehydrogenase (short-subunit alcohol dehydrogenase family)
MTRNIVITGATSGIGEVAAIKLAASGARIVLIARDKGRAAATLKKLSAANSTIDHAVYFADLSSIAEMKRVAIEISVKEPVIDVLINNAGAVFMGDEKTVDGLSPTFSLNHLAYFLITLLLLPNLRASASARVICTASRAHRYAKMNFDDLQRNGILAYAQSKLENLLFVHYLAQLLKHESITINAFHPGFVATRFADNTNFFWRSLMRIRKKLFGLTIEQGASTLIYLATSEEVATISGKYFVDCKSQQPSDAAINDEYAQKLWKISTSLTAVDFSTKI